MTQRHPIQNETTLITTNIQNRNPLFLKPTYACKAVEHIYKVQEQHPFFLFGFVIMPDHCHFLVRVPEPSTVSQVMNVYKSGLTFEIGLPKIWQARFHSRSIRNAIKALQYIHLNPVRTNLVPCPEQYPWSSASGKWDITPLENW